MAGEALTGSGDAGGKQRIIPTGACRTIRGRKEELVLALESTKDVESLYASVDGNEGTLQLIDKLTDNTENEKVMERLSLMEALEHLDAKQRQIIILRYFQDRTQADVARCIGISQVQVSRIEKRVLSELRRHLQEKD